MLSRFMTRREQAILGGLAISLCVGSLALSLSGRNPQPVAVHDMAPETAVQAPHADIPSNTKPLPSPEPGHAAVSSASVGADAPSESARMTVAVRGAVAAAGVYSFPSDARVQDAVDAAGGLTRRADIGDINLAASLIDGTTLTIPEGVEAGVAQGRLFAHGGVLAIGMNPNQYTVSGWQDSAAPQRAQAHAAAAGAALLDLNSASQEALETLPGIGPKLAADIIAYRRHARFQRVDDLPNVSGIGPKRLEAVRPFVTVR